MRLHHFLLPLLAACGTDELSSDVSADVEIIATETLPGTLAVSSDPVELDAAALGRNMGAVLPDHGSAVAVLGPSVSFTERWRILYRPSPAVPRGTVVLESAELSATGDTLSVIVRVQCGGASRVAAGTVEALPSLPKALRFIVPSRCEPSRPSRCAIAGCRPG